MDINIGLSMAQVVIGVIGLLFVGSAARFIIRKTSHRQVQKTGDSGLNIQAGGDVNIHRYSEKVDK